MRPGNGDSVLAYREDLPHGHAMPILRVREFAGLSAHDLAEMLGTWHPPQGYQLIDRQPQLREVCAKLTAGDPVREITLPSEEKRVDRRLTP